MGASYHFGHTLDNNLNSRLKDYQKTLRFAVEHAAKIGCKVMVFTGDIFKSCRPGTVEQDYFWSELERGFLQHGIKFYLVAGNHDMPTYARKTVQSIATKLNDYSYVVSCDHICSIDFNDDDTTLVMVPFFNKVTEKAETNQEILDFIDAELQALETLDNTVAVWHGLSYGTYLADYTGNEVDALSEPVIPLSMSQRFNVCVFGHVHRFGEIARTPESLVINLGSMEVNDFTDSAQDKYMLVIDTNRSGKATKLYTEAIKLPVIKADTLKIKMSGSVALEMKEKITSDMITNKIVRIQIESDDDTMATFDAGQMEEYIESMKPYKYMGTSFLTTSKFGNGVQEIDLANHGDLTIDSIRGFLERNNLALVDETVSYAKEIILKVDGESE